MIEMRRILGSALLVAATTAARPAAAQCSANASTCLTCHEIRGENPVLEDARAWHSDHGFGDLCAACHAGDPTAAAKESAHAALRPPLAEPIVTCGGCHDDAETRARLYRFSVESTAAPTPAPPLAAPSSGPPEPRHPDRSLAGVAFALALVIAAVLPGCSRAATRLLAIASSRAAAPDQAGELISRISSSADSRGSIAVTPSSVWISASQR